MPVTSTAIDTPAVWIGCLRCYNAGRLVGRWFDAVDAEDVTPTDVHEAFCNDEEHEELWVMDQENLLSTGEMSPREAAREAERLMALDSQEEREALRAWHRDGSAVEDCDGLPDLDVFHDRYQGHWDSFEDYTRDFVEQTGMLATIPEDVSCYFDHAALARDLSFDYTILDAPHDGVFVFTIY